MIPESSIGQRAMAKYLPEPKPEDPTAAKIGRVTARNLASAAEPFIVVPPGSLRTWSNPQANWERVQLMLGTSGGAALDADLEVSSRRLDSRP